MTLALDHVVVQVRDLDAAAADYAALGFTVVRGGEHPGRPTHNALVVFADGSYFELIAYRWPAPGERWWQAGVEGGDGLVDFALLPDRPLPALLDEAGARGLALEGPIDGGRTRPDGIALRWQTARSPQADLPFLCADLGDRALRVPEGAARTHANGALGVAALTVGVRDLAASLARYRALLGLAPGAADVQAPAGAGFAFARVPLAGAELWLVRVGAHAREGPLGVQLRTAGPVRALDRGLAHGAALALGTPFQ